MPDAVITGLGNVTDPTFEVRSNLTSGNWSCSPDRISCSDRTDSSWRDQSAMPAAAARAAATVVRQGTLCTGGGGPDVGAIGAGARGRAGC